MVTSEEMGSQAASITSMGYNAAPGSDAAGPYENVTILMGHTDLDDLTGTFDDNWSTSGTQVFSSPLVQLSGIVSGEWFHFPLDDAFEYDGTSNLLIELVWNGPASPPLGEGSIYTWIWSTTSVRSVSSNDPASPTGFAEQSCHYLQFEYEPLSLDQTTFASIKSSF
jgi:hypothetical protein